MDKENIIHKLLASTGTMSILVAYAGKKIFKKELLPISGWKQASSTYLTIMGSGYLASLALNEWYKRNLPAPKPK